MGPREFYDALAATFDLIYPDWRASSVRQAAALDRIVTAQLGPARRDVLDCACGIGTQAIGLAALGHRVIGTDLSPESCRRARAEARDRGVALPVAVADMRALPLRTGSADVVVCADNSLPHLLTPADVGTALAAMRRVLRPGGLLLVSTRDYDAVLAARPRATPPSVSETATGRSVTFQLWDWHDDGEHYDLELVQARRTGTAAAWTTRSYRSSYWALTRDRLAAFAAEAGLQAITWHPPESSGFFQPLLTARAPR